MKRFPFPLTLIGAAIVLTAAVARAQESPLPAPIVIPPGPTSGFSSAYVQVIPSTVANLPVCSLSLSGARAVVSDALNPAYGQMLVDGGDVEIGALCNGVHWIAD